MVSIHIIVTQDQSMIIQRNDCRELNTFINAFISVSSQIEQRELKFISIT